MKLLVAVSSSPNAAKLAISSLIRVWEEFDVDTVSFACTPRGSRVCGEVAEAARSIFEGTGVEVEGTVEVASNGSRVPPREEYDAVLTSTGSLRLASMLSSQAAIESKPILHVDFFYATWRGLYYPYTPRMLHPLSVVNAASLGGGRGAKRRGRIESLEKLNLEHLASLLDVEDLPPLRRRVAESALRANRALPYRVALSSEGRALCEPRVELQVELQASTRETRRRATLCGPNGEPSSDELRKAVGALDQVVARTVEELLSLLRRGRAPTDFLSSFIGAYRLGVKTGDTVVKLKLKHPLIIDTNLIYKGIHLDAWEGVRVHVPYCARAEVMRSLAEGLKGSPAVGAVVAALGLLDLEYAGAGAVASPPPPCDTAIPYIDQLLLSQSYIATNDVGAYNFWSIMPVSRIVQGTLLAWARPLGEIYTDYYEYYPRLLYAIHQAAVIIAALRQLLSNKPLQGVTKGKQATSAKERLEDVRSMKLELRAGGEAVELTTEWNVIEDMKRYLERERGRLNAVPRA